MTISKRPSDTFNMGHLNQFPKTIQTTLHEQVPIRRLRNLKHSKMIRGTRDVERLGSTDLDRRISRKSRRHALRKYHQKTIFFRAMEGDVCAGV